MRSPTAASRTSSRLVAVAGAVLTVMHLFLGVANLIFFHERNQHLWEMLFANISQPDQILNACVPYMKEAPFLTLCIIAGSIALGVLGIRKSRALSGQRIDLWSSRRQCLRFGAIWLVLLILPLDRNDLTIQRGWKLG